MQFKSDNGAILDWWQKKGTIRFQGPDTEKKLLEEAFGTSSIENDMVSPKPQKAQIFVVHGHDLLAIEQLELILHRLNLTPFVLQNHAGESCTIIETLEEHTKNRNEFGIVLMTPDDARYPKDKKDDSQPRTRQNVVLEMGMLISSLGRKNVAILRKGHLEIPLFVRLTKIT
jgi:predicted nucleotide-binding protein